MKRAFRHGMGTIATNRSVSVLGAAAAILVVASASAPAVGDHVPGGPPGYAVPGLPQPVPGADEGLKGGRIGGTIREPGPPRPASPPWSIPAALIDGIPATVLAAYQHATAVTAIQSPGCRLQLTLLAAIGKVETGHASGGWLDARGTTVRPIIGPVLDGQGVAMVPDTDGGRLDGDPTWDHAVGPMQFIPQTWARWAADGNADRRANPHNVFDASLAAANYLCADNRDLGTPAGLSAAILAYNRSDSYLSLVLAWMNAYAGRLTAVPDAGRGPNVGTPRPVTPLVQVVNRPVAPAPAQAAPVPAPAPPHQAPAPAANPTPSQLPPAEEPQAEAPPPAPAVVDTTVSLLIGPEPPQAGPGPELTCDMKDLFAAFAESFTEAFTGGCPCRVPPPAMVESVESAPELVQFAGWCAGILASAGLPEMVHRWPAGLAEIVDHLIQVARER